MWESILASSIVMLVFLAIIGLIYYIFSYRKMKNQKAVYKEIHLELAPGKKVMFAGGLYGTVQTVGTDICDVKLKSGAVVEVSRYAIQEIVK